jgi:hypothetical protein
MSLSFFRNCGNLVLVRGRGRGWRKLQQDQAFMTRHEKLGLGSLAVALVSCILAALVVPEVRLLLGLPLDPIAVRQFAEPTGDLDQQVPASRPVSVPTPVLGTDRASQLRTAVPGETVVPAETVATTSIPIHSAVASSVLPPSRVAQYGPEMALDGSGGTAWVEAAPGQGIGEWIELRLGSIRQVTSLEISNGYNKGARYQENGRIRSVTAHFSGGETRSFTLADHPGPQSVEVGDVRASSVRLVINTTYAGTRWEDTALGDVRVIGF